jgi:hypothetical protein
MSGTMGGVAPPVALGIRTPEPMNPLQMAGQGIQLGQGMAALRRENETFNAQSVIGQAAQQAFNPQTGQMDYQRFQQIISANPMAGFLAPQFLQQMSTLEQSRLQVQGAQAQLGMVRLNNLSTALQGLLVNPNPTREQVLQTVTQLLALPPEQRPFSAEVAAAQLAQMPSDPQQIRPWLMRMMASTQQGIEGLQRFLPQPSMVGAGGQVVGVDTNPLSPSYGRPSGPTVAVTPTPAELNQLTPNVGPNGETLVTPRVGVAPMVDGQQRPLVPGGGPAVGGAPGTAGGARGPAPLPNGQSPFGTGRYPGQQGAGRATVPPGAPPGSVVAQMPPGAPEAMAATGVTSAQAASRLVAQADRVPEMRAALQNLDQLVGQFVPGPTADWSRVGQATWNQMMQSLGLPAAQIRPDAVASQEEFAKQAMQLAQQQFAALGGTGTDTQLASTIATSPNPALSLGGNRGIIALLRGNLDALEAKNKAWGEWQARGNGPETYQQFERTFNAGFNPRVFQFQYLDAEGRRRMTQAMSRTDQQQFQTDTLNAVANGWIRIDGMTPEGARALLAQRRPAPARTALPPPQVPAQPAPRPALDVPTEDSFRQTYRPR